MKKRCRDDSPKAELGSECREGSERSENFKAMQMEGKPLLANGQKAIFRMHGKEATPVCNLVDQAFIVLQSEPTTQIHINKKTYSEGQVRIKQLRT